jgi:hypothetical protein
MAFEPAGTGRPAPASLFARRPELRLMLLRAAWPHAVGPEMARRCEPVALESNVLRVRVPDAAWRRAAMKNASTVLGRLHGLAGSLAPRRLSFFEEPRAAEPATPQPPAVPPAPDAVARAAEQIPDPELRERFLRTAALHLDVSSRRRPHA